MASAIASGRRKLEVGGAAMKPGCEMAKSKVRQ